MSEKEKPWSLTERIVLIALTIGLVYGVIRVAVVVPEWGWRVVLAPALIGPALYYYLAFRGSPERRKSRLGPWLHEAVVVLLVAAAALPVVLLAWWWWFGALPWA